MASLYLCEQKPQEIANLEDKHNDEINLLTGHEDQQRKHSEVMKQKMKRKRALIILKTSLETSEKRFVVSRVKSLKQKRKSLMSYFIHHLNNQKIKELYKKNSKDIEQ